MSLVTVEDLKKYMSGIGLDSDQTDAMQDVLDGLQRELERYCQRNFGVREVTEALLPDELGRLWPTAVPLVSVTSPEGLSINGSALGSALYGFTPYTVEDPLWATTGRITVTYTAGIAEDDPDLADVKLAILRVAAREATTRHDDVLDPNDLTARRVDPIDRSPLGFTPDELSKFDRLRRRTVA